MRQWVLDLQKQPPELFYEKGVLRNLTKFTRKHLCQSLFFNKVAGLRPATLLKKRIWHRCFPVNFAKFLRIAFLQNTSGQLLLDLGTWVRHFIFHNSKGLKFGRYLSYMVKIVFQKEKWKRKGKEEKQF